MKYVLCAGRDPLLLATRGLMLQSAGFATDLAIGERAALAALVARHYEAVVLCHTLTEQELSSLQAHLREHAPRTQALDLKHHENGLFYSPPDFIRTVALQIRT